MTLLTDSPATVLLADHDPQESEVVRHLLEREKYRVHAAENGNSVLNTIYSLSPDIVLLRADLPGKSGLDICREIKKANSFGFLPLLLIGKTNPVEMTAALDAG